MNEPSTQPLRVMICAGEISGDMYGAALVRELRARSPRPLECFGLGGDRMREEGVELYEHASKTGVIGFLEVAKRIRFFARLFRRLRGVLDERRPDLLLTIDYPGMNLRLAREARARGIPAVHYVCPQVWAWHRDRIPKIAASLDGLICLFPFEPALFEGTGLRARFAGHPLVDQIAASLREPADPLPWGEGRRVAVFAGSRRNEVRRILPDVLAGAAEAEERLGPCTFLLPVPTAERAADVRAVLARARRRPKRVEVIEGRSRQALREAEAAVVKSGTSTLEAALLGCPHVVVYRVGWTTYAVMRRLLTAVRHIALSNIVPGRTVATELIQGALTPEAVRDELVALLSDPEKRAAQLAAFEETRRLLGGEGATARAAAMLAAFLAERGALPSPTGPAAPADPARP